ncbi:MAG: hypothetical protein BMS9Abin09_0140 [Gammaproteobacteria bacterium]|nr:MAG: hypothetical protein BMS9Abin09_0140 [Gammaproteobacteria bacterium]
MDPYLTLLIQSIVLPFGLSGLLLWLGPRRDRYKVIGNAAIWLIAYAWIIGLPNLPPEEALDWLWLLLAASYTAGYVVQHRAQWLSRTSILLATLVVIAWPVLRYQLSGTLVGELVVIVVAGGVLFNRLPQIQPATPALTLVINTAGLAVASALSGSLLVGQLATALAAITGGYATAEIISRLHTTRFSAQQMLVLLPVYLGLLAIARLYAELPLTAAALLLVSPLAGISIRWKHAWVFSLSISAGAVGLVLLNSDNTAYY